MVAFLPRAPTLKIYRCFLSVSFSVGVLAVIQAKRDFSNSLEYNNIPLYSVQCTPIVYTAYKDIIWFMSYVLILKSFNRFRKNVIIIYNRVIDKSLIFLTNRFSRTYTWTRLFIVIKEPKVLKTFYLFLNII